MAGGELDRDILDDAARAGWLYYVGGRTQDEIAKTLGVSRQRAQRLVAKAVAEGLIQVRLSHPIANLMQLGRDVRDAYGLERVRVAPDLGADGNARSMAPFAASMMEEVFSAKESRTIGFGTGRALRSAVDALNPIEASHHRLLSVIGNVAPDGTANFYDVLMRVADIVRAPHYPLIAPVIAQNPEEKEAYLGLSAVQRIYALAEEMDTVFVGVGQLDETAPILKDGFMKQDEWENLRAEGAVGEIVGRIFDRNGVYIESPRSDRTTSVPIQVREGMLVAGIAAGIHKVEPLRAALKGKLLNALVTDEPTARALLSIR